MNKSEAGKLGYLASMNTAQELKKERIDNYNKNPKLCEFCQKPITYNKRHNTFCNKSCSASFFNKSKKIKHICMNCRKKISGKKYCNINCQHEYQHKESIHKWKNGGNIGKAIIKTYLLKHNNSCWECGITKWNNKPIVLELEHNDGNSNNDNEENLSLLCPNCHSQTDTYKGKNKGHGRHYRRLRYAEGKSF